MRIFILHTLLFYDAQYLSKYICKQVITLETAKAAHDTIDALKSGSATVQALQQGL
jgi:hypothetical protein